MTVRLKDVVEEMKAVIAAGDRYRPRDRADKIMELVGGFLSKALAGEGRNGRTAILMIDRDLSQLTFAYPEHLARGNVLPIDRNSFAGQVVLNKEVMIENSVPGEPHKDFFERIPDSSGVVRPIQKMVASPLFAGDGTVIGVVEVSRAGPENSGAAANFIPKDAKNLETCCRVFAPYIDRTWTRQRGG